MFTESTNNQNADLTDTYTCSVSRSLSLSLCLMGVERRGRPQDRHFVSKKFCVKFSQIYLFPKKLFDFHPPKFLMTFFSHQLKILNFPPIFPLNFEFPPIFTFFHCFFRKIVSHLPQIFQFSPLFSTFSFFTQFRAHPGPLSQNRA